VQATVADVGAQKDIFPSLHTAVPTMLTLFAFRYRRDSWPLRWSWPLVGFAASQIIGATMFLRWHYLIDICAGISLAALAVWFSDRAVRWDDARRERLGLAPAWTALTLQSPGNATGKV
jgi:membrane-associated phospholipid phosphatase